MFTGIIEETGIIKHIDAIPGGGKKITIAAEKVLSDVKIDDSIAVSGVCLTVTEILNNSFKVDAVAETLKKTTLGDASPGQSVNLERAMKLSDRLGGHIVQGHVNETGFVSAIQQRGDNLLLTVEIPGHLQKYLISEGSIAIDGVSLTITKLTGSKVDVSIIPHTFKNTTIAGYKINRKVNIETDFLAKYIENFVQVAGLQKKSNLNIKNLKEMGY